MIWCISKDNMFKWNLHYHSRKIFEKYSKVCYYLIVRVKVQSFLRGDFYMRILENELKNKTINYDELLKYGFIQKIEYIYIKLKYIMNNLKCVLQQKIIK